MTSLSSNLTPTGDLVLKEKELTSLPKEITQISSSIIQLDLRNNNISQLNSVLASLTHLRSFDLRYNLLEIIPESISCLIHLKILRLDNNHLTSLPAELFSLTSLSVLTLNRNFLHCLQETISELKQLTCFSISSNHVKFIPAQIGMLKKLKTLFIHGNDFSEIPSSICGLSCLEEFSLEWFRYCCPPLPRVLKNKIGVAIIESLQMLCNEKYYKGKAQIGLIEFIQHFSDEVFDIQKTDQKKRTCLHIAVISGDNGVIEGLINAGCCLNTQDADGFTPFVLALKENNLKAAYLLMDKGADITIGAGCYGSPLNLAAVKSEPKIVTKMLETGLDPNTQDICGNTPLHGIMEIFDKNRHKNALVANILIQFGAELNKENSDRWSPVHIATKEKQHHGIKWMHKKNLNLAVEKKTGFDFNKPGGAHGWCPLHIASHSGDYSIVETLVKAGCDPSLKNIDGKTPKDTSRGNLALYKYLSRLEKQCYIIRGLEQPEIQSNVLAKEETSQICREYRNLYLGFRYKDKEEIEELIENCENTAAKADSVYLLSMLRVKTSIKEIYKAKKNKEALIKNEVRNAMNYLKDFEGSKSLKNFKVRLSAPPNPNSTVEYIEEETRVDTLLLYSN